MSTAAFIDITGGEGDIYLIEKGARPAVLDKVHFSLGEGYEFFTGELPADIDETFLSLPLGMLDFRVLELSMSEREKAREVLPYEVEGLILEPVENVVMDAVILEAPEGPADAGVLAVYIRKPVLRAVIEGLGKLNLDPRVVTSLELSHVLERSGGGEELSGRLLKGGLLEAEEDRAGLALKEMGAPCINLRRGEFSYTREAERTRRTLRVTAALLASILLVFGLDTSYKTMHTKKEISRMETRILRAYTDIFPSEKPARAEGLSYKARARLKQVREKAAALKGVSALRFMLRLQEGKQPGSKITRITLDKGLVVLKGEADSLGKVQEVKERLEGVISEVKITDTSQSASGATAFTITAREDQQ
jgi:type II secretory pathway component PulL